MTAREDLWLRGVAPSLELWTILEGQVRMFRASPWTQEQLEYAGPWDFVLRHGVEPGEVRLGASGAPRSCYGNAIVQATLGQAHGFPVEYVEGYVLSPAGLTVQHAWVSCAGVALEVTWPVLGLAYLGVEFSVERADWASWDNDATVLDDPAHGWPLLQQPWAGVEGVEWPVSERLQMIRDWPLERRVAPLVEVFADAVAGGAAE